MKVAKKGFSLRSLVALLMVIGIFSYAWFFNNAFFVSTKNYLIAPFLYAQSSTSNAISSWGAHFKNKHDLTSELSFYKKRSQELQGKVVALKAEQIFNKDTEELIEYKKQYQIADAQLARVLFKHCDDQEHFFLIGLGSNNQIKVDSSVVYKNCLLGKIIEVQPSYSKVRLITDRHCKVAVFCTNTKTPGIYEGTCSKESAVLNHVSHMQQLEVGDTLLSAGEGLIFPYGFGVGIIESFEQKGIQYEVKVKPLLDSMEIDYCYVIPAKNAVIAVEAQ